MLNSPPRAANSPEISSHTSPLPRVVNTLAADIAGHAPSTALTSAESGSSAMTATMGGAGSVQRRLSSSTVTSDSIASVSPLGGPAISEILVAIQDIFRVETATLAVNLKSSLTASLSDSLSSSLSAHLRNEVSEELRRWQTTTGSVAVASPSSGLLPSASARRLSAMFDDAGMSLPVDGETTKKNARKSSRQSRSLTFSMVNDDHEGSIVDDEGTPNVCVNGKRLSVLTLGGTSQLARDDPGESDKAQRKSIRPSLLEAAGQRKSIRPSLLEESTAQRKSIRPSLLEEPLAESPSLRLPVQRIRRRSFRFLASSEIIDEEQDRPESAQGSCLADAPQHDSNSGVTTSLNLPLHNLPNEVANSHADIRSAETSSSLTNWLPGLEQDFCDRPDSGGEISALSSWNSVVASQSSQASSTGSSRFTEPTYVRLGRCRSAARSVVEWTGFDYCISTLVILNAASIGIQANYMVGHIFEETPSYFRIGETAFCVLWTAEIALRLSVYGYTFFRMADWRWNLFDTAVVGLQLFEELVSAAVNTRNAMPTNLNAMRLLRVLRLVRIIRLVRLLRFIQELRTMVCSIANSFRSLCWTIVLLMLMVYVVSVCLTQLIADHGRVHPEVFTEDKLLQEYYGSLLRSVLSLFQAITGGLDWNELLAPLVLHISPLLAVVFSFYICFAVFAMMNVITGVFVESALTAAKADREGDLLAQLHALFLKIDVDKSGVISWDEFSGQLDDPHMETYFKALDIDASEAYGLFALLDVNNSGEINVEEFVLGCLRLRGAAQAIDLATLTYFNKRMSARTRAHAQRVEAFLSDILELLLGSQACGHLSPEANSASTSRNSYPSLLESPTCDNSNADLATWAELKAKGQAARQRGRGSFTISASQPVAQTAVPMRKMKRAGTYSFEDRQSSRQGSKREGLKSVTEAGLVSSPGDNLATESALENANTVQSPRSCLPSASIAAGNEVDAGCDAKEDDLSVSTVNADGHDCFATWGELKADGERRRDERRAS